MILGTLFSSESFASRTLLVCMPNRPTLLASERERFTTLIFYGVVLLLGYLLLRVFQPFFGPLGWAAVLAICVSPWNEKLVSHLGRNRAATSPRLSSLRSSSCRDSSS